MAQKALFGDKLTDTSTVQARELGTLRESDDGDKQYRYVKNIDLTASAGWALTAGSASSPYTATGDRSGGSAINSVPIGVVVATTLPLNSYGWVQTKGYNGAVLSDGSVAAGEALIAHASTDGSVDSAAAGSTVVITVHQSFGLALAADTTSRVKVLLNCP